MSCQPNICRSKVCRPNVWTPYVHNAIACDASGLRDAMGLGLGLGLGFDVEWGDKLCYGLVAP